MLRQDHEPEPVSEERADSPVPRQRAWQRMLSGRKLDLLDPSPADIELDDIALGLARVARWNGQTIGPHVFSVAQHSLFVEAIAGELAPELDAAGRLAVLLHDAPEYVVGDLITPLKSVIGGAYAQVEARLLAAVHRRFGLSETVEAGLRGVIKRADRLAAGLEATRLAGFSAGEAEGVFGPPERLPRDLDGLLSPWPAEQAANRFRSRAMDLMGEMVGGAAGGGQVPGSPCPSGIECR